MALGGQHVLGFSPDGKLFALINDQGILRIWDTETNVLKQEYTPNLHLSGPCTALTWASIAAQPIPERKSKKARKLSTSGVEQPYIVLGTSAGKVSLYSYGEGKIERSLEGAGHSGKITGIAQDDAGHIFTCGDDCQVIQWSLTQQKQLSCLSVGPEKPYSIVCMPHSQNIVVGSRLIKVYSLATRALVQTFTGHASDVHLMTSFVVSGDDEESVPVEYAVTASRMERIICLWKIGKKGKNKLPTCTLLMEDVAYSLTCAPQPEAEGNLLKVAAVTRSGVMHVYALSVDTLKAEKPIKPKVTVQIASDSEEVIEPIPAVGATMRQLQSIADEILLGYGDKHFLVFEQVKPDYKEKMQVLVRRDPKTLYAKKGKQNDSVVLKTLTPAVNPDEVNYKSSVTMARRKMKSADLPMEERLRNLNLLEAETNAPAMPLAQSKVKLLVQALHSKDQSLLRSVLMTKDEKTVELTLSRLPVQYVGSLVSELTHLMEQKRTNVSFALIWLKILAQTHASQLMAFGADDLFDKFGPCIGIIEHRANCLKEISKCSGRLDLLVRQIKRNVQEDQFNNENALVYEDHDSSNSDLEMDRKSSESEWEEEGDEDEEDDDEDQEKGATTMNSVNHNDHENDEDEEEEEDDDMDE